MGTHRKSTQVLEIGAHMEKSFLREDKNLIHSISSEWLYLDSSRDGKLVTSWTLLGRRVHLEELQQLLSGIALA
jgi:hypothetical protein